MGRTKGSKNVVTLIKEATSDEERNRLIESNKHLASVQKYLTANPIVISTPEVSKQEDVTVAINFDTPEAAKILETLPTEVHPAKARINSDLAFNPKAPRQYINTRANDNHSYYQYIHPCNLHLKNYQYRYFIVRDGVNVESQPYDKITDCHADLVKILEGES